MFGAITGSTAWAYYCRQNMLRPTEEMQGIREQAAAYLPTDLLEDAPRFHDCCTKRAAAYGILRT